MPQHLRYHQLATIELPAIMCEYYEHVRDRKFLDEVLLPCADDFIAYYANRFPKRDVNGKMLMEGVGCVETYQGVNNPCTEIGGLKFVLGKLLSFDIDAARRANGAELLAAMPDVPVRRIRGMDLLAVGDVYEPGRVDCETPELYSVYPFRQAWLGTPAKLALARNRSTSATSRSTARWTPNRWKPAAGSRPPSRQPISACRVRRPAWRASTSTTRSSIGARTSIPTLPSRTALAPVSLPSGSARWTTRRTTTTAQLGQRVAEHAAPKRRQEHLATACLAGRLGRVVQARAPFNTTVECVYGEGRVQSLKVTPSSREADIVDMSSLENRIRTLVDVACADRNYLFDLPPMLDGQPKPGKTTGAWLEKYGESVTVLRPPRGRVVCFATRCFMCTSWTAARLCRHRYLRRWSRPSC